MKPIIALDADGVLLNFHQAYAKAWEKAFGSAPAVKDPQAYWPLDRWDVRRLSGEELARFRDCFDADLWSTMPPLDGAVDACHALADAGYELVCVSAIESRYQPQRLQNLRDVGFPIERVIATANATTEVSPKAAALHSLNPVVFVDDYLPYLRGIPPQVHAALVMREPKGSPNVGEELALAHSRHADLADFAGWWLERPRSRAA